MSSSEIASYTFDAASRITGITQSLWAQSITGTLYTTPLTWAASYDSRNRLTGFNRDGASTAYTYDPNSNRLASIDKTISDSDLDGVFEATDQNSTTQRSYNIEAASNRLLGLNQTLTTVSAGKTSSVVTTPISYGVDASGNLTSDGLRTFEYDAANRLSKVRILKDGEAASVRYLHNALGQRVFKGEPTADQFLPDESALGQSFIDWLKSKFAWLYASAQANTSIGTAYIHGDGEIPAWALLGQYNNGSATTAGRTEYIWLPTENGGAIPVGIYRGGRFFAIHTDHLGTPRLMTDEGNRPVWQWLYSAFGDNEPTGILKAPANPRAAIIVKPARLAQTTPAQGLDMGFPGQMRDAEAGLVQNINRWYLERDGRYTQFDPIGWAGGPNGFIYVNGNPFSLIDPTGLAWIYQQSTGNIYRTGNNPSATTLVSTGSYSGAPGFVNNPYLDSVGSHGPIPTGEYSIGSQQTYVTGAGKKLVGAMTLTPSVSNWPYGRSGFLIHGDNQAANQSASEGCIIAGPALRNLIGNSGDRTLNVVP